VGLGKIITIIGGILGIMSIVLFYLFPEIFSLWRLDGGFAFKYYIGGFGMWSGEIVGFSFGPEYIDDIFLVLVAVILITGGGIAIGGAILENKDIGLIGGMIMLIGPTLLTFELLFKFGFFEAFSGDRLLMWGSDPSADWGVWIGFFIGVGGGILGLIGGLFID
jgi:hypothetical protein